MVRVDRIDHKVEQLLALCFEFSHKALSFSSKFVAGTPAAFLTGRNIRK